MNAPATPAIPGAAGAIRPYRSVPGTAWMAGPTRAVSGTTGPTSEIPAPAVPSAAGPAPGVPSAAGSIPAIPSAARSTEDLGVTARPQNTGLQRATIRLDSAALNRAPKRPDRTATTRLPALSLTPDLEEKAHHLPLELVRRDIAGDHPGLPLMLRLRVLDENSGDPVTGAVIDIRHCDALARTQVRGAQLTDKNGYAEFRTVHPGWHPDEPVHIAVEVHVGGYLAGGRSVAHTGRLGFPESLTAEVAQLAPYRGIRTPRAVSREHAGTLTVVPRDRFHLASGLLASIVVAVTR
ncbi:hypothetical protein AB0F72_04810 [Actinoplanes sp. NPDC023936]|uniref:hypothetical protein n=1 Tax=Actinoplanes sp. NPDC023936 TaxID=3154910 RepID=UPI0033D1ABC3